MNIRRLACALLFVFCSGCMYDEVSSDYANGINVYNFRSKENPVQIIGFENGVPSTIHDVLIDGIPLASYKKTMPDDLPIRRDEKGQFLQLTYHYSERHDIKFSYEDTQYQMPLTDKQLRHIFGSPKKVDRRKK